MQTLLATAAPVALAALCLAAAMRKIRQILDEGSSWDVDEEPSYHPIDDYPPSLTAAEADRRWHEMVTDCRVTVVQASSEGDFDSAAAAMSPAYTDAGFATADHRDRFERWVEAIEKGGAWVA